MNVNIDRLLDHIDYDQISFLKPLYESIVNSFQADALNIKIEFIRDKRGYITEYIIKDDGCGFTKERLMAFMEYGTYFNKPKYALGTGRLIGLKIFEEMCINSHSEEYSVDLKINKLFLSKHDRFDDIKKYIKPNKENDYFTNIHFKSIQKKYLDYLEAKQDSKDILKDDIKTNIFKDDIKTLIIDNLLPLFIRLQEEDKDFKVLFDDITIDKSSIQNMSFEKNEFKIKYDIRGQKGDYEFKLYYKIIEDNKGNIKQFYGGADRNIKNFTGKSKINKLKNNDSGIFCLYSKYFNDKIKDDRANFTIKPDQNNISAKFPITFPEINDKLREELIKIYINKYPEVKAENKKMKKELIDTYPHLQSYINKFSSIDKTYENTLKEARNNFDKDIHNAEDNARKFMKNIKANRFDLDKFNEIRQEITTNGEKQLGAYIAYRQTIIDALLKIDNKNYEENIHNIFMNQYTYDNNENHSKANMWLLDDKFMFYNMAFSDKMIKDIIKLSSDEEIDVKSFDKGKKPDLVAFYSSENNCDIIIIEFKKLGVKIDEKMKGVEQIKTYPSIIRRYLKEKNIHSIYSFLICDIDEEFEDKITNIHGFKKFSFGSDDNMTSVYHDYNENVQAHLQIMSYNQIIQDANKRNKVFLDILKKH